MERRFTIVIFKFTMVICLLGCNSNPEFVTRLNEFEDITAMSVPAAHEELQNLANSFVASPTTVTDLEKAYTRHSAMRERFAYFGWFLAHEAQQADALELKIRLRAFLLSAYSNTKKTTARHWLAAGLKVIPSADMQKVFQSWLKGDDPAMWKHATHALLCLDTKAAVSSFSTIIENRKENSKFLKEVREAVQDSECSSGNRERFLKAVNNNQPANTN